MSASAVQTLASAAVRDGCSQESLVALASLGAWGEHPGNASRDLHRHLGTNSLQLASAIQTCTIPLLDSKKNPQLSSGECHILLPHLTLWALAKNYGDQFASLMATEQMPGFWRAVLPNDPRLQNNPMTHVPQWQDKFIALWMHGDGVSYSTDNSLLTFSFGSLLCLKSSLDSSLLIAAWPKSATASLKKHGVCTWTPLFKRIAWSFTALFEGIHPHTDWDGNRHAAGSLLASLAGEPILPNQLRCVVWTMQGDLEYAANCLKYPHWNNPKFCWFCSCNKSTAYDFTDSPGFSFLDDNDPNTPPATSCTLLTGIPGPLPRHRFALDVLHTLEAHGVSARLVGSVLHLWSYSGPGPPAQMLAAAWEQIQAALRQLGPGDRMAHLFLSMFSDPEKPWQEAPSLHAHAAEIRHLVPAMAAVAASRQSSQVDLHVALSLQHLAKFYHICSVQPIIMTAEGAAEAELNLRRCLQHYSWLHKHHQACNMACRFRLFPKFHFAIHIAQFCRFINPSWTWTYKNEDFVGRIATLCHSVSHGTAIRDLSRSLCRKYAVMLHVRLQLQLNEV